MILEEYGPEIIYIKGEDNIVADAMSHPEYDPEINVKKLHMSHRGKILVKLFWACAETQRGGVRSKHVNSHIKTVSLISDSLKVTDIVNNVFANISDGEDAIYPPTITEIATAQRNSSKYKKYFRSVKGPKRDKRITLKVYDETDVLVFDDKRLVIPSEKMQTNIVTWYHHYLQHPGKTRLEETIKATMYWKGMLPTIRAHVKTCERCQKGKKRKRKYSELPPKIAETTLWRTACVDLIGPYTIKSKDGTMLDYMCLTMINPATGWFEIAELPNADVTYVRKGKEIIEVIVDKSSVTVSQLFNKSWLSRYPRAKNTISDNGSEFKLHFKSLVDSYGLKRKPTSIKNPQANAVLERIHAVVTSMMRTSGLDNSDAITPEMINNFLVNVAWAIRSTYHTVLKTTPGAAVFGRDMLFDIPLLADWTEIGRRRQALVNQGNIRENKRRVDFDYAVGQKVLLIKDGILGKAEDKNDGPYVITQVHTNGTVRIQRGTLNERLNIRRLTPYFERTA